ncbi:hypothetical protein EVAR_47708_1 [Eumeta japonica]|uniref:Uncharacterized protein n=1 Tax=Eumeta variegata TaxID=151549 RepID=A0A4C1XNX8_EUMVA|nr:hypothetical protein EVAR_47708_1 [Eumeta japonica]
MLPSLDVNGSRNRRCEFSPAPSAKPHRRIRLHRCVSTMPALSNAEKRWRGRPLCVPSRPHLALALVEDKGNLRLYKHSGPLHQTLSIQLPTKCEIHILKKLPLSGNYYSRSIRTLRQFLEHIRFKNLKRVSYRKGANGTLLVRLNRLSVRHRALSLKP